MHDFVSLYEVKTNLNEKESFAHFTYPSKEHGKAEKVAVSERNSFPLLVIL